MGVEVDPGTGCWLWTGRVDRDGYATVPPAVRGPTGMDKGHRAVWKRMVGPLRSEEVLDHVCWVKRCVNPAHLDVVSEAENKRRRGGWRRNGRCGRGHRYDWDPAEYDAWPRVCPACMAGRTGPDEPPEWLSAL